MDVISSFFDDHLWLIELMHVRGFERVDYLHGEGERARRHLEE